MARFRVARSILLTALVGATLVAPLSGYQAAAHPQAAKITKLLVDYDISDAKTLDPDHMYEFTGVIIARAAYDMLVGYDGSNVADLKPDLATSWQISGGGTIFTFKLRQGVKFASGNPVTADDVVFSYSRLLNLADNPSFLIAGMKEIKAIDPATVQITLKAPDVSFLAAMTAPNFAVLDSKLVKSKGGTAGADAAKTDTARVFLDGASAGSGAYVLKEWTRNTRIVLERNPNYWGTAPAFQQVVLNYVKDPEAQKLQLQKGDTDIALSLTNDQVASLKADPNVRVDTSNTIDYAYLAMNTDPSVSTPLSNPLVRQAVRYAIDYDGIIKNLLNGAAVQPASVIPVGLVGNSAADNETLRIRTNVNKARSLLAQAGYPHGFSVTLTYGVGYSFDGIPFDPVATKIIHDLQVVGIHVAPKAQPISVALAAYRARKQQIVLMPWGADFPDAYDFASYFGPGGGVGKRLNYFKDGNLADLIAKADATSDVAGRAALYKQVEQQFLKTGPYAIIAQPAYPVGLRADIKGFAYSPVYHIDFGKISR